MKNRVVIISIFIVFCLFITGCKKEESKFLLDEKYYTNTSFIELEQDKLNKLIDDKESFGIFIYQPLCSTSYEFNKVITEFSKKYNINFYKMSFSNLKDTTLSDKIKYYPSFVIYHDGEVVDFLDANSNEDTNHYQDVRSFKKWFSQYVVIKDYNENYKEEDIDDEVIEEDLKIDTILENVSYSDEKVNIYFFWGDGCPHCEEEFKFFRSIETEYGNYFTLNTFEVWHNEENEKLLNQFASKMKDKVTGVPYTIIGNKTFKGFNETYEDDFLEAIKTEYKNSYDVYFDKN